MEGRHCFSHLTVEENLLTGAFTRRIGRAELKRDLDLVYTYFPRLTRCAAPVSPATPPAASSR
jgi:branched-chain amino acid transport system ATP-binding protein